MSSICFAEAVRLNSLHWKPILRYIQYKLVMLIKKSSLNTCSRKLAACEYICRVEMTERKSQRRTNDDKHQSVSGSRCLFPSLCTEWPPLFSHPVIYSFPCCQTHSPSAVFLFFLAPLHCFIHSEGRTFGLITQESRFFMFALR